jgi:hypothetical protein
MNAPSVEDLVRLYIHLPSQPSAQGWYPVLCKVCNDHGRKGPRAAFKFEDGGVAYNCFNCGEGAAYDPNEHKGLTKKFQSVLVAFGVPEDEINRVKLALIGNKYTTTESSTEKLVSYEPQHITLPEHFKSLDYDSVWSEVAKEYLAERGIDYESYPFMVSTGKCKNLNDFPKAVQAVKAREAEKWVGRVIIPIFKDNNPIFYVGRDMTDKKDKKYESPSIPKQNVIFGFDQLFDNTEKPLYIVEGIFDALVIDGVAILGNKLTEGQIYWLNRSNRKKVYIPDKFGDGYVAAEQAIEQGWSVAFPQPLQGSYNKDVNDIVQRYGKLFVLSHLAQSTSVGFAARTNLKVYCKNDKRTTKTTHRKSR